jgi:hypothetical protein
MDLKKYILATLVAGLCSLAFAEGSVSYVLHKSDNPTEDELDAYQRITTVMDSAVYIYNKYTNLTKFINVYYAPGVPTAEASSNGDLRFGNDRGYMFVGTAMHEMAHTMGMGTTNDYRSMFKDGVFLGEKAQAILKEIDGPDAELHGDNQHFWPYGLNYASEVHSEQDLINHARIVEAMYQDIFKEAFYWQGHLQNVASGKCMGITSDNGLKLMDCADTTTFIKVFSVGEPVAYRIQLGTRSLDVPNESTAEGVTLSTYGYNGGTHQKMYKELASDADTTVFYLKIVKSGLYVKAGEESLTQETKFGDETAYQWKMLIPKKEEISRIGEKQALPRESGNATRNFDLKGRHVGEQSRRRPSHAVIFKK